VIVHFCLILTALPGASAQAVAKYHARLSRGAIDVAALSTVAGSGAATAEFNGKTLTIAGKFDGLLSPATAVHLDRGVAKGVRGKPVASLQFTGTTEGTISGTIELTSSQLDDLKQGRLYIQIDSEKVPDGNLWGWILPGEARR
jgi:hypothetical protein